MSADDVLEGSAGRAFRGADSANHTGGFAVLPPKTAPANDIDMNICIYGGAVGSLTVDAFGIPTEPADGFWVQDEGVTGQAQQFTSLAGIIYPVAGTQWQPLPHANPRSAPEKRENRRWAVHLRF
jgi:hypothetical protein